jgi:quercetin dioxygenase-like cupin family protein
MSRVALFAKASLQLRSQVIRRVSVRSSRYMSEVEEPNPSLNTDVPYAGLRPRNGPSVNWYFRHHNSSAAAGSLRIPTLEAIRMEVRAKPHPELNQLVRSSSVEWQPLTEPGISGVFVKVLRFDHASGRAPTIMLKFEPGASYPGHVHPGGEEIFVLEGDIRLGKDRLLAGDYLYTAPLNIHAVHSDGGCVVLVSVPQAVEVLRPKSQRETQRERGA